MKDLRDGAMTNFHVSKLEDVTQAHLKVICDTAVSAIAKAKGLDSGIIFSNIKSLLLHESSPQPRYRVVQRSTGTPEVRSDDDKRTRKDPYYLAKNGVYAQILDENDNRDYCLIPDSSEPGIPNIAAYVKQMHIRQGDRFAEPTVTVSDHYNHCLVVPIRGPWSALDRPGPASELPLGEAKWTWCELRGDAVLGFICIDSKSATFNSDFDLNVANQLAREAFYTIRGYYSTLAKLQKNTTKEHVL